jgi:hypothetical protein
MFSRSQCSHHFKLQCSACHSTASLHGCSVQQVTMQSSLQAVVFSMSQYSHHFTDAVFRMSQYSHHFKLQCSACHSTVITSSCSVQHVTVVITSQLYCSAGHSTVITSQLNVKHVTVQSSFPAKCSACHSTVNT